MAEASSGHERPFGLTIVSVALGFWGVLWAVVGLGEPGLLGALAVGVGLGAIAVGAGLFSRYPPARPVGIVVLLGGTLWYARWALIGRGGAAVGAVGGALGALYLLLDSAPFEA
ncbi:MAG: hypothetical protein ABEJ35_01330 [Halobacteriaceae archaeon]